MPTALPPIAIPSYRRAPILKSKTIRALEACNYPLELITIFVASHEEAMRYRAALPNYHVVVGHPGYSRQLDFICNHYDLGTIICLLHDDVAGVKSVRPGTTLKSTIELLRDEMLKRKCGLAGINPNSDLRNCRDILTEHLAHVVGCFFLFENRRWAMKHLEVEDYERSIRYYQQDGRVLRWRGAGVDTKYNGTEGGLTAPDRMERKAVDATNLEKEHSYFCTKIDKRGTPDIRLNWRAKPS